MRTHNPQNPRNQCPACRGDELTDAGGNHPQISKCGWRIVVTPDGGIRDMIVPRRTVTQTEMEARKMSQKQEDAIQGYHDDRQPWERSLEDFGWPILQGLVVATIIWRIWVHTHPPDPIQFIEQIENAHSIRSPVAEQPEALPN